MIEKEITFEYERSDDPPIQLLDTQFFQKTASFNTELQDAINKLERKIDHIYVLVNALSAGEFFGPNRNGDYFPEKELINHHKTYESLGFQYRKHVNKDPKKSFGKVVFAYYNPRMRRVEIIVELPVQSNKDIVEKLNRGEYPATSMGCRVPYDICSICGNKAKTRAQYCDHLKLFMGRTMSDGKRVYAINVSPKFFDNSWVDKPAELTAGVLAKVASLDENKEAGDKEAVINKRIPVEVVDIQEDPKNMILCSQGKIPATSIKKIAEFDDGDILSTLEALRVMPTSAEFEALNIEDVNARSNSPNVKIAEELGKSLSNLVLTKPRVLCRLTKTASVVNDDISEKYKQFVLDFNESGKTIHKLASNNPWLINVWIGDEVSELEAQNLILKEGSAINNLMVEVPSSYISKGLIETNGELPALYKSAGFRYSENLFTNLSMDSLNAMYNSVLNWEEN